MAKYKYTKGKIGDKIKIVVKDTAIIKDYKRFVGKEAIITKVENNPGETVYKVQFSDRMIQSNHVWISDVHSEPIEYINHMVDIEKALDILENKINENKKTSS